MRVFGLHGLVLRGATLCVTAASLFSAPVRAQHAVVGMAVPALPLGAIDSGPLPSSEAVSQRIYLAPPAERVAELDAFLNDVQMPGSSQYRQWLTPASFAARFGATAEEVSTVQAWLGEHGLGSTLSASGSYLKVTGTAAQVQAAFGGGLHAVQAGGQRYIVNTKLPVIPDAIAADVLLVDGLNTIPRSYSAKVRTESSSTAVADLLADITDLVEANASRVLSIASNACVEDVDNATAAAMHQALKQAASQGITVLGTSGCNGRGAASFPASLAEMVSVAAAPGITLASAATLTEVRPGWQAATGLPQDSFRHEPDVTVSSLGALESTVLAILAKQPAPADGSVARLGNIAGTLYTLAHTQGLYTQPDGAATGTWEAATGLGLVDLEALGKVFPHGTADDTVTILPSTGVFSSTYGDNVSYTISVSGSTSATPSGTATISFSPNGYTTTAPLTLVNGQATFNLSQLTALPAANATTYTITATYNGDSTYAGNSGSTKLYVGQQALTIAASTTGSPSVGGTYTVNVTLTGTSGSPTGLVTITPQNTTAQTVNFTGTNGQVAVSKDFNATQAGTNYISVSCTVDANYTCYSANTTVNISQVTPTVSVSITPNPVVAGQATTLSATVTGAAGATAASGTVSFTDANGTALCTTTASAAITSAVSCTTSSLSGSGTVTGTYNGDGNYASAKASQQYTSSSIASKLILNTITSPVVANSSITLTVNLSTTSTVNNQPPTGTISFYDGSTLLGTQDLGTNHYSASLTTKLTSLGTHSIYASYGGDANYAASTSATQSIVVGPATAVTLSTSPTGSIVYGNNVTLTAALTATPNDGTNTVTGSLKFNISGTDFVTQNATLTNNTATGATATIKITQALDVGTYTVNLYCLTNNFDCGNLNTSGFSFNVVKTDTTTTLQVTPTTFTAGTSVYATAVVTPAAATTGTGVITGTVTFYDNANSVGTVNVYQANGVYQAVSTAFTVSSASDNIVAVYNGDGNNNSSKSTGQGTVPTGPVASTTTAVSASPLSALAGTAVALTANVVATVASGSVAAPGSPTGAVNFYDTNNGSQFLVGSATLVANGTNASTAVLYTTGLRDGANVLSATFAGSTSFTTSASMASVTVQISDYSLAFTPASLNLNAGQSGTVTVAVSAVNGFAGQVTLGCSVTSGSATACNFDKTTISGSGLATLTITTTARSAMVSGTRVVYAALGFAGLAVLGLLLPVSRRRRMPLLGVVLLLLLSSAVGCTNIVGGPIGSGLGSGTPAGSEVVTVTTSGTDGTATVRHSYSVSVNVQ